MNILDYIFIALAVVGLVVGLLKGFLKQVLAVVGVVVVATLTAVVEPHVQNWFVNTSMSDSTRNLVAMLVTVLLLAAVYGLLAYLIGKLLKKIKVIKILDRILGAVLGVAVVYLSFAVLLALLINTSETFLPSIKSLTSDYIENSWIVTHIYKNNFFGDWVINGIAKKLLDSLQPNQGNPDASAILATLFA